uniref:Uncharacterized protein n=1 Tax=Oryza sativa subsp. japonica TaxID=39947 RepID=Q6ERP1_ORYSJ|nr:hypothetical protein [Oryza sativa Japonica Group]
MAKGKQQQTADSAFLLIQPRRRPLRLFSLRALAAGLSRAVAAVPYPPPPPPERPPPPPTPTTRPAPSSLAPEPSTTTRPSGGGGAAGRGRRARRSRLGSACWAWKHFLQSGDRGSARVIDYALLLDNHLGKRLTADRPRAAAPSSPAPARVPLLPRRLRFAGCRALACLPPPPLHFASPTAALARRLRRPPWRRRPPPLPLRPGRRVRTLPPSSGL